MENQLIKNAHLNSPQEEAVKTVDGPLLILAGAGSGKTRVITYRIANLIENHEIMPYQILAITFTNKAAKEMRERVKNLVGDRALDMWISTFHSACVRILRREIDKLGYNKNFTIYDSDDQKSLVKQCMEELNINDKDITGKEIINKIGANKDNLITAMEYKRQVESGMHNFRENKIADVYLLYQKKLRGNNALDFDDIIFKTVELFQNNEEVLAFYQRKFKYIMVDEYQDTNRAQYMLIKYLASKYRNLCVVGDDDQCIYSWRGADITNILNFEKDFPGTKVIKLEQNYRSMGNILKAANDVIRNNYNRKDKALKTDSENGEKIKVYRANSDRDEADFVTSNIEKIKKDELKSYKDFAILYRTNAQSRAFEESFVRRGIPYKVFGGLNFYQRKEIKDIMAYLKLINNPLDEVSLRRIVNVPKRSIGDSTIEKVSDFAASMDEPLFDAFIDVDNVPSLTSRAMNSIKSFTGLINSFIIVKDNTPVSKFINTVIEQTGYVKELKNSKDPQDLSRVENLNEFISAAYEFEMESEDKTLSAFLEKISLISDIDNYKEDADTVLLMTLHSAKGLEFPVVFMPGMENGLFPGARSFEDEDEMEESRRLCYVGITRAKEKLFLSSARSRYVFGKIVSYEESDFLKEISDDLLEYLNKDRLGSFGEVVRNFGDRKGNSESLFTQNGIFRGMGNSSISETIKSTSMGSSGNMNYVVKILEEKDACPGRKVRHKKFGVGTIVSVKKDGSAVKLTIAFENNGIKNLMLDMAPLEAI